MHLLSEKVHKLDKNYKYDDDSIGVEIEKVLVSRD